MLTLIDDLTSLIEKLKDVVEGDLFGPPPTDCPLTHAEKRILAVMTIAFELDPEAARRFRIHILCQQKADFCYCKNLKPPPKYIILPCPCPAGT